MNKVVFMLVGPSGVGKSTWRNEYFNSHDIVDGIVDGTEAQSIGVLSMDDLRLRWYNPHDYTDAFRQASGDKEFDRKVDAEYQRLLRECDTVILDNTNITAKSRRKWIVAARAKGFTVVAVIFPISRSLLEQRQRSRTDKTVPLDVVLSMYDRLQYPLYGEVDDVQVCANNLA